MASIYHFPVEQKSRSLAKRYRVFADSLIAKTHEFYYIITVYIITSRLPLNAKLNHYYELLLHALLILANI